MKSIVSLTAVLLMAALAAPAQEHDHIAMVKAYLAAHSQHGPVIPQPETVNPAAAKTFNIVARSFQFDITPATFAVNQGDVVTINFSVPANDLSADGHGLLMETYIEDAVSVKRGKSTSITFTATTVGHFQFACSVSTCGTGHFDMAGIFFVNPAAAQTPSIASLAPNVGPLAGGTNVTINGANFVSGATVTFGGVPATNVNVTSSTTITATTPAHADSPIEAPADVVVTNPDGQAATRAGGFTYIPPVPQVESISPITGPTSGNTLVTIHGSNLQWAVGVKIGGVTVFFNKVDSSTLTFLTPLGPANEQVATKKDVQIFFVTDSFVTIHDAFQYTRPPLAATLVTPSSAAPAGGAKISISGAGFTTALASSITIGGIPATNVQVVDAVSMTATVPAHAVGPVDVVVNVGGTAVTVKGFAYLNAPPRHRSAHP
jgi:plastocyanin